MLTGAVLVGLGVALASAAAATATAAVSVRRLELAQWVSKRLRGGGRGAALTAFPREVMATRAALTAVGVLLVGVGIPVLARALGPAARGAITLVLVVPLTLIVCDVIPRLIGRRWPAATLRRAAPLVKILRGVLAPVTPVREASVAADLTALLRVGEPVGWSDADELAIVSRVLAFADRTASDVMTPRTAVVAVAEGTPPGEVARVVVESGHSRLPVYRGSLDDIVGMIHAFDLLRVQPRDPLPVRPVVHVPGSRRLADLLVEMQRDRRHLAIVLDEYGGTAGIVTLENLLDELVGEVAEDGSDDHEPPSGEGRGAPLEVDGSTPLAAVEAHFGVELGGLKGAESVGGLLTGALGRIPRAGERFTTVGLEFDVLGASPTRLERVVIRTTPVKVQGLSADGALRA